MSRQASQLEHLEFNAPSIGDLVKWVEPAALETSVGEIISLFQTHSNLSVLPVFQAGEQFVGLLSRRSFLGFITQSYAQDLYTRKTLAVLLEHKPDMRGILLAWSR
jgi:CBS-domain-containing membrane protein